MEMEKDVKGIARRRFAYGYALIATVSVLASGCGGGTSDDERWAGDVCQAIAAWDQEMTRDVWLPLIRVRRPTSASQVRREVLRGIEKSERLRRELEVDVKRLAPPTANARKAAEALSFRFDATRAVFSLTQEEFERDARALPQRASSQDLTSLLREYVKLTIEANIKMSNVIDEVLFESPYMTEPFLSADECRQLRILSRDPVTGTGDRSRS